MCRKLPDPKREILRNLLQKRKVECRPDSGLVPMRFVIFPLHLSKVLRLPRKSGARSYKVLHLSRSYKVLHLSRKIICHATKMKTPLTKSAPWPPNMSDGNVSCSVPATWNASLQIPSKTLTFLSLLASCRAQRACHAKPHPNFKNWSETISF